MRTKVFVLFMLCLGLQNSVTAKQTTPKPDSITVYIFLHESCIISQYYTLPLTKLSEEFSDENIQFVGLFPNKSSKYYKIQKFKKAYHIPFDLKSDHDKIKTKQFGATITPEVVVFNETQKEILYKGRIDDAYARVGKRRLLTSSSELKDALTAISTNQPIAVKETKAVGCFISMR